MGSPKKYASSVSFRRALEDRLNRWAKQDNVDVNRYRREISFDRLLSRMFSLKNPPWILKGGYAMELRIKEARATKDIDLVWKEKFSKQKKLTTIQNALEDSADIDLKDFFEFRFGKPMAELTNVRYGGARYPVEAHMATRVFAKFHIDIGLGDVIVEPLEKTEGRDWLKFAGIPQPKFLTISKEQHLAEKIHAYTQPRKRPNSRVRDLVDMVLLIKSQNLITARVKRAIDATFRLRKTHDLPDHFDPPPPTWEKPFKELAEECGLKISLSKAFDVLKSYIEKIAN